MTLEGKKLVLFRHFNSIFGNNQCQIDREVIKHSMNTLGERIAFLRKKNQMSQNLLMKELHFNNLGKYELNERLPKLDLIIDLARFFNVTTDWLLLGTESNHKNESNCPISSDVTQKQGPQNYNISAVDQHFLSLYHQLTDRQQAKVEGYIEGLLSAEHTHP